MKGKPQLVHRKESSSRGIERLDCFLDLSHLLVSHLQLHSSCDCFDLDSVFEVRHLSDLELHSFFLSLFVLFSFSFLGFFLTSERAIFLSTCSEMCVARSSEFLERSQSSLLPAPTTRLAYEMREENLDYGQRLMTVTFFVREAVMETNSRSYFPRASAIELSGILHDWAISFGTDNAVKSML
jgi:hypothetical protein